MVHTNLRPRKGRQVASLDWPEARVWWTTRNIPAHCVGDERILVAMEMEVIRLLRHRPQGLHGGLPRPWHHDGTLDTYN